MGVVQKSKKWGDSMNQSNETRKIAYFSMEIALESTLPTYSGGLGVLAGDTIKSAADLRVPMVGVSLLYRKGYFYQLIDSEGMQSEQPVRWEIENYLTKLPEKITVEIEGQEVVINIWEYRVESSSGFDVPVYFLDSDDPSNSDWHRSLTDSLYGGDEKYRLCQETILGIGGIRALRALGYNNIRRFHLNEGHASLLTLELLKEECAGKSLHQATEEEIERVRKKCVFTTHTPVPAGHDQFPLDLAQSVLGEMMPPELKNIICCDDKLNMTYLALNLSNYVNGVAKKHGEISSLMFSGHKIEAITNGIYAPFWASGPFKKLFDKYIQNWREDNFSFRSAISVPRAEIWEAHLQAKKQLLDYINQEENFDLDIHAFTIGFARRSATYKRADLIFRDVERLKQIVKDQGPIQIIFSGKSHPKDAQGKALIQKIYEAKKMLEGDMRIIYLSNYNVHIAYLMVAGVDIWLNNPRAPMEASGTSGMKAALNGVPSFSVLDGWWIEGCLEGMTGWAIGNHHEEAKFNLSPEEEQAVDESDAASLYDKLENKILPLFYQRPDEYRTIMRNSIALNGAFFTTQRMVQQYVVNAYYR